MCGGVYMEHLFQRNGKFVNIEYVDCERAFDTLDAQIACELEKQLLTA